MEKREGMHSMNLSNRNFLNLNGVVKIMTFSELMVVADTKLGQLTIKGKDMKMNKVNVESGDLEIEGRIDSLVYTNSAQVKSSIIKKLFK